MIEEIKKLALPLLMAEGMEKPEYIDVIALDRLWIDTSGNLMAPPDFAKTCKKQRPHLFELDRPRERQPDRLSTFVYPKNINPLPRRHAA